MQEIIPFSLTKTPTKLGFVKGDNAHILYQLDILLETRSGNMFIYGPTYGKTHIMQAYTLHALELNLNALYINLKHSSPILENLIELSLDIIFIDNLEFASMDMQQYLFDLYNQDVCIVLSSHSDNNTLTLFKDLNTRINKSIKLEMSELSDEEKKIILLQYIKEHSLAIKEKHIEYLFTNFSRDLKKLMQTIQYINTQALIHKAKITTNFIKRTVIE